MTELLQFAKSRRGGEMIAVVIWAIGVSLLAALLTYHPNDSSAFFTSRMEPGMLALSRR